MNAVPSGPEGILILDKPAGITSHDCVSRIRRLYRTKKVGHAGTLDPMATGVLPILIGSATRAADFLSSDEKRYEAVLRLGLETDTEDTTGTVLSRCDVLPEEETVRKTLRSFLGEQKQIPPMYSALKVGGEKLYDLARRGLTAEREPRTITVHSLEAERISPSEYRLTVHCSKGTYIRTLCADIGRALGCGGTMAALRRLSVGPYSADGARTLEELETCPEQDRLRFLQPVETLFENCPVLMLSGFFLKLADNGLPVRLYKLGEEERLSSADLVRISDAERGFFALGKIETIPDEDGIPRVCARPIRRFV